jgi:hypothetical protein
VRNILQGPAGINAAMMNNAWMNSPEHRANILSGAYRWIGIGVAYANGEGWATEESAAKTRRRLVPSQQRRTGRIRQSTRRVLGLNGERQGQEPVRLAQPPPTVTPPPTGVFGK